MVAAWLAAVFIGITILVALGGATRITGSGLSMVEWRPLMGVLPPLSDQEWERVFGLYRESPQYLTVNMWMDLDAFKRIFWLEYLHRASGRALGLLVAIPWLYFLVRGSMDRRLAVRTGLLLVFGAAQGGLGWFMVRSGLVDAPHVSHFRLAAHLLLAFFIAQWVVWASLDLLGTRSGPPRPQLRPLVWSFIALLVVQIMFGAFMAGTRAGWLFSTFPDLNGTLALGPLRSHDALVSDLLYNPAVIHWVHRTLAWATLLHAIAIVVAVRNDRHAGSPRRTAWVLLAAVVAQFTLGVATVVLRVPPPIAVIHQVGALWTLSLAVGLAWQLPSRSRLEIQAQANRAVK